MTQKLTDPTNFPAGDRRPVLVNLPATASPVLFTSADGNRWLLAGTDPDGGRLFVPEQVDPTKTPRWVWAREAELIETVGTLTPERNPLAEAVAEHGPFPVPVGPEPAEVLADVVAGVIRDFDNDAWASTKDQVAELRYALFEYRDRASDSAEVVRLRTRVAELEAAAGCSSQMTVSSGTSQCALPVRHRGDHRNAAKNHYWSDEYADAARVRPDAPAPRDLHPGAEAARRMIRDRQATEDRHDGPLHHGYALGRDLPEVTPVVHGYDDNDDSHEAVVARYLATPYTDDGPRPLRPGGAS